MGKSDGGVRLTALGNRVAEFAGLETFPAPKGLTFVRLSSDEVTALCPVTGQPDQYTVLVTYRPKELCVESKTVKLLFQHYRQKGLFVEALSAELADIFSEALDTSVEVTVTQKPRGGVTIVAESYHG